VNGRVALVTGGASGIGAATVALLRAQGAIVVPADIAGGDGVERLDVSDEAAVDALVAGIVAEHGRIDLAANCAGVDHDDVRLAEVPTSEWRRVMAVNLDGVLFCMRAELRAMTEARAGAIVNVASAAGVRGVPKKGPYAAAKAGVISLTRTAALEVARRGVRVNAVLPGMVRTPMLLASKDGDEAAMEADGAFSPIGRLGTPEEIAAAIAWLLSDGAAFVTGATIAADGGVAAV
jgi:NAD(P)-dependent dehydrogenase (short-subunit alcohol dehydrogenase family)